MTIPRHHAWLHVAQALTYAAFAWNLWPHWTLDVVMFLAAFALQGASAWAVFSGRAELNRTLNRVTVALVLIIAARFGAQTAHVLRTFGHIAGGTATRALQEAAMSLPLLLLWPAFQSGPFGKRDVVLSLCLVPLLDAARPYPAWADGWTAERAQEAALAVAERLRARNAGAGEPWPELPADLLILLTPVQEGKASATLCATPDKLDAVAAKLPPHGPRQTVIVDVAERRLPAGWLVATTDGADVPCPKSPSTRRIVREPVLPGWQVDYSPTGGVRFRSAAANPNLAVVIEQGWSAAPPLGTDTLTDAVAAGARHLMRGMNDQGRFTYIVKGPSGEPGRGYNFPRHAGTAWFLARAGNALDDDEVRAAADRAITYLHGTGGDAEGGRRWVEDPTRTDGKAWIGTTALATAAALEHGGHEAMARRWLTQLAASVDEQGHVCGEMETATTAFICKGSSAYGQGQTMLALAQGVRAYGDDAPDGVAAALDRTLRFLASGDYIGSAAPHVVGDEHWMCITAHAIADVRPASDPGLQTARVICEAYLRDAARSLTARDGFRPSAGSGGGVNEAITAHAFDTGNPHWREVALSWADALVASQYLPTDGPLLGDPAALIGGFRSGARALDVQIDVVQHIGCSLLSTLALLRGEEAPGLMP